jgi:hypothetical protein
MGRESNLNPFARNTQVPAVVRDVTGREVVEGDEIVLNTNCQAPLFRVLKIAPVVDPNAPPGLLQVDLVCRWRFHAARNTPVVEFIKTRGVEEVGEITKASPAQVEAEAPAVERTAEES